MHAKLNNGEIEFAPINKITENEEGTHNVIFNYHEDEALLKADGFLPYQEDEIPTLAEEQELSFEYIKTESLITKMYTIIEV